MQRRRPHLCHRRPRSRRAQCLRVPAVHHRRRGVRRRTGLTGLTAPSPREQTDKTRKPSVSRVMHVCSRGQTGPQDRRNDHRRERRTPRLRRRRGPFRRCSAWKSTSSCRRPARCSAVAPPPSAPSRTPRSARSAWACRGTLPTLNAAAVESAIRIGLALNCEIASWCRFARKNYFYPDQPKNYQISQYDEPIAFNGHLNVPRGRAAPSGSTSNARTWRTPAS